jgi:EAL domain-containing protein (putative c-di-GMP-specific phosphodiesterase class I)
MAPITVMVADDEEHILEAVAAVVGAEQDLTVVGVARDADGAVDVAARERPDVAVIDVRMPAGGGPRAAARIIERSPTTRVLALSADRDVRSVREMIDAGALGYVVKSDPTGAIIDAIHRCARGDAALSPAVAGPLAEHMTVDAQRYRRRQRDLVARIRQVIERHAIAMVFQPIVDLRTEQVIGVEALARFEQGRPSDWFAAAASVGMVEDLEFAVLDRVDAVVPATFDGYVAVNLSPSTVMSRGFEDRLGRFDVRSTVIEVTEHAAVRDYAALGRRLARPRSYGLRLAVDDTGAGFASLRHVVLLEPDIVKIDISLISEVDRDVAARAAVVALVGFAREIGATTVAEGVERESQLRMLRDLDVDRGQGFLLGTPRSMDDLVAREAGAAPGSVGTVER